MLQEKLKGEDLKPMLKGKYKEQLDSAHSKRSASLMRVNFDKIISIRI
jgi:hypothetical protein